MENRLQNTTKQEFRELLESGKIRAASLEDVHGTHHQRKIYKHPNTGQFFVEVK